LPLISAKIILNITDAAIKQLILSALSVFIIEFILYIMFYFKGFFYQKIYKKTIINLQTAIARETLNLEIKEIDKSSSGLFIDRLNKDTADISGIFMEYTYWTSNVISNIGVLVTIFILNKYLFIYAVFTSIIMYLINKKNLNTRYKIQKNLKKIQEKKTGLISEVVRGIRDIKVLNANETILNQTVNKVKESAEEEMKMQNVNRIYMYLYNNVQAVCDLFFIILGCVLYEHSLLTIPTFVVIYNYQSKIKNLLTGVAQLSEYNKKFVVASDRIFEIIEDEKFSKEKF